MNKDYKKCIEWAEKLSGNSKFLYIDTGFLEQSIKAVENDIKEAKEVLKILRPKYLQLKTARDLDIAFKGELLSVQCDGKTISINCIKGNFDVLEKGILKRLGFSWNKTKLEFVRKVAGVDIEGVRTFIKECEEWTEEASND